MPYPPVKVQDILSIQQLLQELRDSIQSEFTSVKQQQFQILSQLSGISSLYGSTQSPESNKLWLNATLDSTSKKNHVVNSIIPKSRGSSPGRASNPNASRQGNNEPSEIMNLMGKKISLNDLTSKKNHTENSIVPKSRVSSSSRASEPYGSHQSNGDTSDTINLQSNSDTSGAVNGTPDTSGAMHLGSIDTNPKTLMRSATAMSKGISKKSKLQFGVAASEDDDHRYFTWKNFQRFVVSGDKFELIVASLILANSVVLCCEVQYQGFDVCYGLKFAGCKEIASVVWPDAESVFLFIDWVFGIVFVIEMVIKILCLGVQYLKSPWNYLDGICVLAFVADKIASAILPIDSQTIRLLRLSRLVRLIRLMRYLESLDVLYVMTTAIAGMSKIVAWAVALLSLMLMTSALFLTQVLHTYYFDKTDASSLSPKELERYHEVYEYFGSFTRCFLSMFELTLANWPPITRLLSEEVSEWFMLVTIMHKLTIGFAVIGVLNGVILQETFKVAATDDLVMLRQKQRAARLMRQKMQNLFDALDISGDGQLDFSEFLIIAANKEVSTWLGSMDIETDDLTTLFKLLDVDNSGTISVDELLLRMPRIKGAARGIDMMALTHALLVNEEVSEEVTTSE